jgi:hypothetical protein
VTALLIFSIFALIVTVAFGVSVALILSNGLSRITSNQSRQNERHAKQIDTLLDRLVAIDWEKYAVLQTLKEDDVGGFEAPGDTDEDTVVVRTNWGRTLTERTDLTADEEKILAEDFPDERRGT